MGHLADLCPLERAAVRRFRNWCHGRRDEAGTSASFEALCDLLTAHARRPLACHDPDCRCIGGDEACVAALVGHGGRADREEAMLMAALMVNPSVAMLVACRAQEAGMDLRRSLPRAGALAPAPQRPRQRLH